MAYATPVCVLPSALWRLHAVLWGNQACFHSGGERAYVASLSVVSFTAACLTVGLVSRWGEVFPGWLPAVGGRGVDAKAATVVAGTGAALIFAVYAYAVLNPVFGWRHPPPYDPACPPPDQTTGAWLAYAAYAPLLLWGPLLLTVTVAYYRRRTRHPAEADTARRSNATRSSDSSFRGW
jgi:hypothetical protein